VLGLELDGRCLDRGGPKGGMGSGSNMQANTAKILESSPTLMRRRELEVLEKVSEKANLTVVLGEKGLADRVVKLL
jgi:hypothetical protein